MKEYNISLREIYSADDLHKILMEELPLPDYYGSNLDSLYDVLTEPACTWQICFCDWEEAEAALGKYFRSFRRMCENANKDNPKLLIDFK